ncbi:hypothetical protein Tco_0783890, partial [Tanacetum coccineum]
MTHHQSSLSFAGTAKAGKSEKIVIGCVMASIFIRPVWGCDRLVIRAKVIENQIMAASAIAISSDSSDESVGSPPSRVILFGDIPTVIPSTSMVAQRLLLLLYKMVFPRAHSRYLLISPFYDRFFEAQFFDGPPSQGPYVALPLSLEERELVTFTSSLISIEMHHSFLDHHPSSSSSSSDSSPFILQVWMHQIRLILDLRLEMYHLDCVTLRGEHHDVVRHFVVGVLLLCVLHYLLCIPIHQSYFRSSIKRDPCIHLHILLDHLARVVRSQLYSVSSSKLSNRSLAPTPGDLVPYHKRFRDSYSSEASIEEDTEVDPIETEVDMELGIGDGDDVRDHVEIDPRDIRDDTGEYEADTSARDMVEVGIDPMSAPMVEEEIVEPAGEDSFDSSGTRDGIVRSFEDMPIDLDDAVHDFYHHMSKVCINKIVEIKTVQIWLEADQLIARGERVGMIKRNESMRLENFKVRPMLDIERDRMNNLCLHMSLSQEEFR